MIIEIERETSWHLKNSPKNFKKGVDKLQKVCYNKYVIKRDKHALENKLKKG